MEIWHASALDDFDEARGLLHAFLDATAGEDLTVLVALDNQPLRPVDPRDVDLFQTAWGKVMAPGAECRWRAEPGRVALSIVSARALDIEAVERADVDVPADDETASYEVALGWHGDLAIAADTGEPWEVVYFRGGRPWLTRTEVR